MIFAISIRIASTSSHNILFLTVFVFPKDDEIIFSDHVVFSVFEETFGVHGVCGELEAVGGESLVDFGLGVDWRVFHNK